MLGPMTAFRISLKWGEITVDGVGKFKDAKVGLRSAGLQQSCRETR